MELKSCSYNYSSYQHGLQTENLVKQDLSQKYLYICQRLKLPFSEIDLVFYNQTLNEILLVEVKSLSNNGIEEVRISKKQLLRLQRAQIFLIEELGCPVELRLAFVRDDGRVTYLNDFVF